MKIKNVLKDMEDYVAAHDITAMARTIVEFDQLPEEPVRIMDALSLGMERARKNFANKDSAIPDLLLSIDCFRVASDWVAGMKPVQGRSKRPAVVIGVVEGDVHHMGKNIVAAVLSANGFQVHDAGRDVPNSKFLDMVKETGSETLALSVMMSTSQDIMAELIRMVRIVSPKTNVIVGGASMDAEIGRRIGADGYAENAISAPEEFFRVLKLRPAFSGDV